jgi:hypothetical protein
VIPWNHDVISWNRDVILWNHDVILVFAARFPDFSALLVIVFLPCPLLLSGSFSESTSLTSL